MMRVWRKDALTNVSRFQSRTTISTQASGTVKTRLSVDKTTSMPPEVFNIFFRIFVLYFFLLFAHSTISINNNITT